MKLSEMISGGLTLVEEMGGYLDRLSHRDRLKEIYSLGAKEMAALYHRAGQGPPITMEHYVPDDMADTSQVIHYGINSLPAFRKFQKRFCRSVRLETGESTIYGYNEGPTRPLLGPGYFVTHETAGWDHWEPRGAVVIDYHMVPEGPVAPGWPRVIPNEQGLQQLVYSCTRDFMRKVSDHVSIGAAFKHETPMGAYFVLCREP